MADDDLERRIQHLESQLRALRAFETAPYRAVVEDMTELVVRWRPDGTRLFVNDAYCRMFNATRDEVVGTSFWPLVTDQDRRRVEERIANLTPDNPVSTGRHRAHGPDGDPFWMEWTDRALFDEDWNVVEYQSVGRDISDRVKLDEKLRQVEQADAVSRASAAIAHDLANVFQLLMLELRSESGDPDDQSSPAAAVKHGAALVNQLRQLTYGTRPDPTVVDLNERAAQAADYLQVLGAHGLTLELRLAASPVAIVGDVTQVDQILLNLVRNAVEASGGPTHVIIETERAADPPRSILRVRDHSGGIDPTVLERLFEPRVTTKSEGQGQGLATVQAIVNTFAGTVRATNHATGAQFELTFPAAATDA